MGVSYAYAVTPKKIPTLFDKIQRLGAADKGVDKWLAQAGFATTNDRRFRNVLRQIGFIDKNGDATALWRAFRGPDGPVKLAEGIRAGYADLFEMYPDAHLASDEEIAGFIRSNTSLSGSTVNLAVATFKSLAQLADFGGSGERQPVSHADSNGASTEMVTEDQECGPTEPTKRRHATEVVVNVSLELTLPESRDPAVYDALFAALAKHILQNHA